MRGAGPGLVNAIDGFKQVQTPPERAEPSRLARIRKIEDREGIAWSKLRSRSAGSICGLNEGNSPFIQLVLRVFQKRVDKY